MTRKLLRYGPLKKDNRQSQKVQNTRWSYKVYWENHENLESVIYSRREKICWWKDPDWYILSGCALTITFVIAMMPPNHILRKFTGGYNLSKSQEKINRLIYKDDINLFAKNEKRIGNSYTDSEMIPSGHRDGTWNWKMCRACCEKWETTQDRRNVNY